MPIADDIRKAIQAAKAASTTPPGSPFKVVLEEVAKGLTDDLVEARLTAGSAGRWTLWLAPAYRPGRAVPMLTVVIGPASAEVLVQPKRVAVKPDELAEILKGFVTLPEFMESLQATADLVGQSVEGFLRVSPQNVTRDDVLLEVTPAQQREIAERDSDGEGVTLELRVADVPGAGTFKEGAGYKVLESAGYTVTLSAPITRDEAGTLHIHGRATRTVPS